jgi:hypothetical protein
MTSTGAFQIFIVVAAIFGGIMLAVKSEVSFRFGERRRAKLRNRSLSWLGLGEIEVEKMQVVDTGPDKYRVILDVRKVKAKLPRHLSVDIPPATAFRRQRLRRRKGA